MSMGRTESKPVRLELSDMRETGAVCVGHYRPWWEIKFYFKLDGKPLLDRKRF